MVHEFSQFCSCGRAGYAFLKARTDACADQGRSYEFRQCRMPPNCIPTETTVGFWRDGSDYLIYLNPVIRYQGGIRPLASFFSQGLRRFPSFETLVCCLQSLGDALLPPGRVSDLIPPLYRQINASLQKRVLGQERAVEAVAFKLYGHVCKQTPSRPLSLIFFGPTCVGKSEMGKAIAPVLNQHCPDRHYQFVWTELNTFTEPHSVYRLTGAPPGYVGYDDQPVFEAVRKNPRTVFMFDELDKAHPEVLKVFMSILDEGRCSAHREDSAGSRELDFRRCVFVFTTNADLSGAPRRHLGFAPPPEPKPGLSTERTDTATSLARRLFQADEAARQALVRTGVLKEIAGRFSGLINFQNLNGAAQTAITAKQIIALGREYGLQITQVAPAIAKALTPTDALSLRSTVSVLEGVLTPLFLGYDNRRSGTPLYLSGTLETMRLLPAAETDLLFAL